MEAWEGFLISTVADLGAGPAMDGRSLRTGLDGEAGSEAGSWNRDWLVLWKEECARVGETILEAGGGGSIRLDIEGDALARFGSWVGARGEANAEVP